MKRAFAHGLLLLALAAQCALAHPGKVDDNGCHVDSRSGKRHCHADRATPKQPRYDEQHPPRAGDEGVFYGPFVGIKDGDTFRARIQGVVMEFRLSDVDAPEHDQPYGARARDELNALIAGRDLVLVFVDVDRYGRVVAQVWSGTTHVNREMVRRGAVWFYADYARDNTLFNLEEEVRDARRGLWALPASERIEPWVWRERKRQAAGSAK
ncbi:MAG TPA: thermonuclease family protein [Povalibacter sp.]